MVSRLSQLSELPRSQGNRVAGAVASLRESNRAQAGDIARKLEAIGCAIAPLTDWDAEPPAFTAAEIELLARMEHDRWRGEREAAGWRLAADRSEGRKESPYLVPYEDLPPDVKEIDRATVRTLPAFLAEVDFAVVQVRGRNDGPPQIPQHPDDRAWV